MAIRSYLNRYCSVCHEKVSKPMPTRHTEIYSSELMWVHPECWAKLNRHFQSLLLDKKYNLRDPRCKYV